MIVCIAEKPSVARDIARVIGANQSKKGYMEGNGYAVTWTFGHLCSLKEPEDYYPLWKRWSLGDLPLVPSTFGIKLIENQGIEEQFEVIKSLVSQAEFIINCGDAGQEGELIQRWVLQKAETKCPIQRLWISSLTDEAIREGFKKLRPSEQLESLYFAGLARAIGDWLLGINATRLFSLRYGNNRQVLSIGRVQTPTLALIVQRSREIENFSPQTSYELQTLYRNVVFKAESDRFAQESEAEEICDSIKSLPFTIKDIEEKKSKELPPKLFDLTSLQVEANKKFGMTAEATLQTIQSLYEKKLTTYPRVDTTYLSEDLYPKIPSILKNLSQNTRYKEWIAPLLATPKIKKSKKVFDNKKITDHHAIIPTGVSSSTLREEEEKIYSLVATRFIAAFYPDASIATTTVRGVAGEVSFKTTGKVVLKSGWYEILKDSSTSNESSENELPIFSINEEGEHAPYVKGVTSQPPKYYTEATLLRAMETAGKQVQDDNLRELLKENGIGRPSTRASIIETLFKRNYIFRDGKALKPTSIGYSLVDIIQNPLLKSAELTGIWERKIRQIEKGEYETATFLSELKDMVYSLVKEVRSY